MLNQEQVVEKIAMSEQSQWVWATKKIKNVVQGCQNLFIQVLNTGNYDTFFGFFKWILVWNKLLKNLKSHTMFELKN